MIGGVAGGVAAHLGLSVVLVRAAFVAASIFGGGVGLLLYVWLWALVPAEASGPAAPRRALPVDLLVGLGLLMFGLYLLAVRAGWAFSLPPQVVVPLVVVAIGTTVAFSQLDEVERARWAERAGVRTRSAILRVVGGALLVVVGVLLLVVQGSSDVGQLGSTLVAAVAVLAGAGLVLAPWGIRLWRDLDAERAARVREAERADIAAHLHDSVLQTLALIQRRSADSAEVARLARAQERDLRSWLYGAAPSSVSCVSAAVAEAAADAEDLHGAVIEVVSVGDRPLDERSGALVAALREAIANAARHAGGTISVYIECTPDGVEAFVRDRGPGFELASVPADRLGVRESVIGRMERYGGSARVLSTPGEGTEVRLMLPEPKPSQEVPA